MFLMPKKLRCKSSREEQTNQVGQNLARIRKEKGITQVELAQKTGITQVLVSNYESGRLRLNAAVAVKFAQALGVTTDELLGLKKIKSSALIPKRNIFRRLKKIEELPKRDQQALLRTIDGFISNRLAAQQG